MLIWSTERQKWDFQLIQFKIATAYNLKGNKFRWLPYRPSNFSADSYPPPSRKNLTLRQFESAAWPWRTLDGKWLFIDSSTKQSFFRSFRLETGWHGNNVTRIVATGQRNDSELSLSRNDAMVLYAQLWKWVFMLTGCSYSLPQARSHVKIPANSNKCIVFLK